MINEESYDHEPEARKPRPRWVVPLAVAGVGLGALAACFVVRKIKKNPELVRAAEMMIVQSINDMLRPILANKDRIIEAFQAGAGQMIATRDQLLTEILEEE